MHTCVYIYIYIERERGTEPDSPRTARIDSTAPFNRSDNDSYWCLWNKHSSRWRWCLFQCPDPAPLISKLAERCPTAANQNECLFHRPIALTLHVSVNIGIGGNGWSPTLTTSRMSVYFTDAGIGQQAFKTKLATDFGHAERWHVWPRPANPLAPDVRDYPASFANSTCNARVAWHCALPREVWCVIIGVWLLIPEA